MSTSTQDPKQILSRDSHEAFRALINSIAPGTAPEDGKLTPEAVEKISEKLKDLIGEDALREFERHRNERGELINEEGLPVTEITEPVQDDADKKQENTHIIDDKPLIDMTSLTSVARAKLRQQRERILDMLEEEEHQESERQQRADQEEWEEILRKRKEEAINEKDKLKKAKELQKKMGKALLRNMGGSAKGIDKPASGEVVVGQGTGANLSHDPEVRKKTVTFVESGDFTPTSRSQLGDVTAAKLRSGQPPALLRTSVPGNNPVKLNVIERKPAGYPTSSPNLLPSSALFTKDSDDESEPEDNQVNHTLDSDEDDGVFEEGGEVELENEYDLDYAQHQREIAMEYYQKRSAIGQDVTKAMMNPAYEENNETTLDIPAQDNQAKPSISHFKANRMASAYGASTFVKSKSLVDSILPESSVRNIQRAIRMCRIDDDNRLVGGEHDSDSENEIEGLQETLELLKKGNVCHLEPEGKYLCAAPSQKPEATLTTTTATTGSSAAPPSSSIPSSHSLPPLNRPRISKFKADHTQAGRPSTLRSTTSTPPTPVSHLERSSPKLPAPLADTVTEKKPAGALEAMPTHVPSLSTSMIIESPSFKAPRPSHPGMKTPMQPFTSMIIESPSFPHQSTRPTRSPATGDTSRRTAIDSPRLPSGQGSPIRRPDRPPTIVPSQSLHTSTNKHTTQSLSPGLVVEAVPLQEKHILTPTVRERNVPSSRENAHTGGQTSGTGLMPRRESRFKQERND